MVLLLAATIVDECPRIIRRPGRTTIVNTRVTRTATVSVGGRAVLQRAGHDPDAAEAGGRFTVGARDHRRRRRLDRRHPADPRRCSTIRRLRVITHDHNQGKGAALRTGFAHATSDYVIVQDADLEYDPQRVRRSAATDPRRQGRRRLRLAVPHPAGRTACCTSGTRSAIGC